MGPNVIVCAAWHHGRNMISRCTSVLKRKLYIAKMVHWKWQGALDSSFFTTLLSSFFTGDLPELLAALTMASSMGDSILKTKHPWIALMLSFVFLTRLKTTDKKLSGKPHQERGVERFHGWPVILKESSWVARDPYKVVVGGPWSLQSRRGWGLDHTKSSWLSSSPTTKIVTWQLRTNHGTHNKISSRYVSSFSL